MQIETTESASVKKTIQKLQRAIVDGLEDVKAQDIQVFDTEHLSPLFERVVIASGNTNRQTRALAASVRDAVREAGFDKPRIEGEENGEWIIVDCGAAVVHIMQPAIRQYYTLEQIWGEKPVRMRIGKAPAKAAGKATGQTAVAKATASKAVGSKKTASATAGQAADTTAKKAATKTSAAKASKAAATQTASRTRAKTTDKATAKTTVKKSAAKPAAAAKKTAVAKTPASKKTSTARKAV